MTPIAPQNLNQAIEQINAELLAMFLKKHKDYGKGNILANGELGIAMRISEKIERTKHLLVTKQEPQNETIDETWIDVAVYAVIGVLYRRGWFQKLKVK
ncbi:MAG: hypothetical protein ABIJ33_00785 [Patescibacteria group bacterium]